MIDKRLSEVSFTDIEQLISNRRREDRTIDYKLHLPGKTHGDKKEFLKDVSSFANATGGDLLYGIEELDAVPVAAPGVVVDSFDDVRLTLQNILQSSLDPRLPYFEIEQIPGCPDGRVVVIVRVPESWRSPHMVLAEVSRDK